MASKVYFTDFCTGTSETLPQKLARLCLSAGMDQIDFKDKFVAIKIHLANWATWPICVPATPG